MLPIDRVSLICPENDLESHTILGIAKHLEMHVLKVVGDWGLTLDDALRQHPDIESLREHVIAVELPGQAASEVLNSAGKQLHHIDHHGPGNEARPSSLEQFAALIGHELTTSEYEIAIADRDFLPGLSRAGVKCARASELRNQEHAIRGETDLLEDARRFVRDHARHLGSLTLFLAPERYANVLLEAAQTPSDADYAKAADARQPVDLPQCLVVFYKGNDTQATSAVRFAGKAAARQHLEPILSDPDLNKELELWSGGGTLGCFFGADAKKGHPAPPFDHLVSRLLAAVGGTSRPLLHYGCTFLLPLDLYDDTDLASQPALVAQHYRDLLAHKVETGAIKRHRLSVMPPGTLRNGALDHQRESQARLYFLPLLRDLLFDIEPDPAAAVEHHAESPQTIHRWRLPEEAIAGLRWRMTGTGGGEIGPEARIRDVSLYGYFNGLYLLAIRVEPAETAMEIDGAKGLASNSDDWWHPLFYSVPNDFQRIERLSLDHWLRFTKHARIVYPSFIEQIIEQKFDSQQLIRDGDHIREFRTGDNTSPILLYLITQFLADDPKQPLQTEHLERLIRTQNLQEERMFVNVAYGLAGPVPRAAEERDEADRLFSLALYVDRDSDTYDLANDYAYDPDYIGKMTEDARLDRWRAIGTYLGYAPYANAYLGFGDFFANVIAAEHVPYPYERMLILGLFYQLTLRNYNRRITHATQQLVQHTGPDPGRHFRELRGNFIEFTNCYWFREVTLAIQGKEIFTRQIAALDIDPEYQEIKEEMERADDYAQSVRDGLMNKGMWIAGIAASILAVGSLILPLLEYEHIWQWILWGAVTTVLAIVSVAISCRFLIGEQDFFCGRLPWFGRIVSRFWTWRKKP